MATRYTYASFRAAFGRTLILWLISNVGGTLLLGLSLILSRPDDGIIALVCGLMAALISLVIIPFWVPFFALVTCVECRRVQLLVTLSGSVLFYFLANALLLIVLPIGELGNIMEMTLPYLLAAFAAIIYMYRIVLPLPVGPLTINLFARKPDTFA